jgi:hypothetical protein
VIHRRRTRHLRDLAAGIMDFEVLSGHEWRRRQRAALLAADAT